MPSIYYIIVRKAFYHNSISKDPEFPFGILDLISDQLHVSLGHSGSHSRVFRSALLGSSFNPANCLAKLAAAQQRPSPSKVLSADLQANWPKIWKCFGCVKQRMAPFVDGWCFYKKHMWMRLRMSVLIAVGSLDGGIHWNSGLLCTLVHICQDLQDSCWVCKEADVVFL